MPEHDRIATPYAGAGASLEVAGQDATDNATRIPLVDALRGFVMVLMALDHTREFFSSFPGDPLSARDTTPLLFLTRWITHICAPTFVLLAGTSIFLQQRRMETAALARFLFLRGLWLIVAELTLVHLVFHFNWQWNVQVLEVISAIGAAMVVMSLLVRFGWRVAGGIGMGIICFHNLLDSLQPGSAGRLRWLWQVLHVPGLIAGGDGQPPILVIAYPWLPWAGVMALGYGCAAVILKPPQPRRAIFLRAGTAMLSAFFLLRWINDYGDPRPWATQGEWWRTGASFLNVQKYPPSLLFLLLTIGLMMVLAFLISFLEVKSSLIRSRNVLETFGRVPFFYFLVHIAMIHLLALAVCFASGGMWRWWITEFPLGGVLAGRPPNFGFGLAAVFSIWVFIVTLCYPLCTWYGAAKRKHRAAWTSYL